jgi:tripartite-type tricarboxylate transporter receptor subunit TctC
MKLSTSILVALIIFSISGLTIAESYPNKPIRFIVPNAPGGGGDIIIRIVGQKLFAVWKQQVIVDNRPGGGSVIGADIVAKAAPDGYTLGLVSISLCINAGLRKTLPYDPIRDFSPITQISTQPHLIVIQPGLPVRSVKELIGFARQKNRSLNYGTSGTGSGAHLSAELFKKMAGIEMTHIPYKGTAPSMVDLIGGQIDLTFSTLLGALPHIKAGKVQAIAVTTLQRAPLLASVPTVSESGLFGFESMSWNGILAPANTNTSIIDQLNREIIKSLQSPELREWITNDGAMLVVGSPAAFGQLIKEEIIKWTTVIKSAGILRE